MDFRKQFELFKIPEFYTYYFDLDRLNFFLQKFESCNNIVALTSNNSEAIIERAVLHVFQLKCFSPRCLQQDERVTL